VQAAILVGDLLLCAAYDLLRHGAPIEVQHALAEHTREVCLAEVEQELVRRGRPTTWAAAERAARQKTGALFAFAGYGAAGARGPLAESLREAGYLAGTAYQLSDDLLDMNGDSHMAGKTLGRDAERRKPTTAALTGGDPAPARRRLAELRADAERLLANWSEALDAWRTFWAFDLQPALDANAHPVRLVRRHES
jgi:geranylgeranyl pyrophosphate synthase